MPKRLFERPKDPGILLTVSGMLANMFPARNRPGCVLEMTDGRTTGYYYVPLSPHDCRREFPEGTKVSFRVYGSQKPGPDGTIDTAGNASRLWPAA